MYTPLYINRYIVGKEPERKKTKRVKRGAQLGREDVQTADFENC